MNEPYKTKDADESPAGAQKGGHNEAKVELSYCNVFKHYHRCYNAIASPYYLAPRAARTLSFCVQYMIMLTATGGFIHVSITI